MVKEVFIYRITTLGRGRYPRKGTKRMAEKPQHEGLDSKSPVDRDRIDLELERSGGGSGRRQRFFVADANNPYGPESEDQKSKRAYQTLLDRLLLDEAYAQAYHAAYDTLNRARKAADAALHDLHQQIEAGEQSLADIRERATRLEDGTLVFQSQVDGRLYDEDGQRLSEEDVATVRPGEDALSWEDYKAARDGLTKAYEQKAEVEDYQRNVLDKAEARLNDKENPMTREAIEELERDIQSTAPAVAKTGWYGSSDFSVKDLPDEGDKRSLSGDFNSARLEIPDIPPQPSATPAAP